MCGRYSTTNTTSAALRERFAVQHGLETYQPSANVKPTQDAPVVLIHDGERELAEMRWGLIPAWAKDVAIGSKMFNARAETLAEKPSFRHAFRRRRCLIPATGFYEWQAHGREKIPHRFIVGNGDVFAFAGLYESWRSGDGEPIHSFTIITTTPNEMVAPVHNRMPVILPRAAEAVWLDPQFEDTAYLQSLLAPFPVELMQMQPVEHPL
jgi:putative SOS response-associated peptidase YedK